MWANLGATGPGVLQMNIEMRINVQQYRSPRRALAAPHWLQLSMLLLLFASNVHAARGPSRVFMQGLLEGRPGPASRLPRTSLDKKEPVHPAAPVLPMVGLDHTDAAALTPMLAADLNEATRKPSSPKAALSQKAVLHSSSAEGTALEGDKEEKPNLLIWQLLLLGITASWGSNFAVIKASIQALGDVPNGASLFVAGRFGLSAVVLAPFMFSASSMGAVVSGAGVGALCAFGYLCQAVALEMGSKSGTAAFICSLQAVVVALSTAWAGEVPKRTWIAVALALSGIGCLELPAVIAEGPSALCLGDIVALGQPIGFGLSYLVIEYAMKEHPEDALPLAALQCLVLAGSFLGLASASSGILPWELPWHELLPDGGMAALQLPAVLDADSIAQLTATWTVPIAVAYTGLITTALTIWLQAAVFKRLPAVDASVVLTTEPLWACLCGAILLHDRLSTADYVGGSLIIAALLANEGIGLPASLMEEESAKDEETL